jgi:hypothetical protein
MVSINDVLKASKGLHVDDIFAELWGRKLASDYTVYTGTLPAVLTGTKAGYLHRYKIYGNTEQTGTPTPENPIVPQECGERTENLFDLARQRSDVLVLDSTKYIYGARADVPSLAPQQIQGLAYNNDNFTVLSTGGAGIGFLVEVKPSTTYTMSYRCDVDVPNDRTSAALNLITSTGIFGTFWAIYGNNRSSTFTTNADTAYVYLVFRVGNYSATYFNIMLVEGATALPYEPYGYKLPLTSGDTPVDIYIGDDTLSTEEYVDSGTGKVYHMVDGVLTPTDPPEPFPQIPTSAGSTTISWAGSGLAPSQVELTYEKE